MHKRNKQKREIIVYLQVYLFFSQVTASTMASKYYLELKIICCGSTRSTQRPSVCNYVCGDSNDFLYSLKACLVDMEVPKKRFICSEFLVNVCRIERVLGDVYLLWMDRSKGRGHGVAVSFFIRWILEDVLSLY